MHSLVGAVLLLAQLQLCVVRGDCQGEYGGVAPSLAPVDPKQRHVGHVVASTYVLSQRQWWELRPTFS